MNNKQPFKAGLGAQGTEFGQDTQQVAQKVKQAQQNKVQDNYQTPNEKYDAEFGSDTAAGVNQKVQGSQRQKVQDNYKTPNEKFGSGSTNQQ